MTAEAAARNAAAAETSRAKQVSELESKLGNLEQRLVETEEEAVSKEAALTHRHSTAITALKELSARELTACKRELENEIATLRERCNSLEVARSEAVTKVASVTAQAEADTRRFVSELGDATSAREEAEKRLREAMGLIEEAKVVDRRNEILDSRMSIEIDRRRNLHEFVEDLKVTHSIVIVIVSYTLHDIFNCFCAYLGKDSRICTCAASF